MKYLRLLHQVGVFIYLFMMHGTMKLLLMMGGCNTRNMQREELSEIKYLRLLHQVGVFIY